MNNSLNLVQRMFFSNNKVPISHRAVRHLFAGGIGTLIYIGAVTIFVEVGNLHPVTSVVLSSLLLEFYTYAISRRWVYRPTMSHSYSIPRFIFIICLALGLNTGIMHVTVNILDLWYFWGLAFATLIVPTTNFLLSYYWAFR